MRGLTLRQPWATLVAIGAKRVETRSWKTSYRGLVAIHSSAAEPFWCRELRLVEPFYQALAGQPMDLPHGLVLCVAELAACRECNGQTTAEIGYPESEFGDFRPGYWRFELSDIHPLRNPIACKGALGLWSIPPLLEERILAQAGL